MNLADIISQIATTQKPRVIIAVAGAPGSGKSTISEKFREGLQDFGGAEIFPMDGYHFDDAILNARGHRARKGAPHTFDIAGFGHMLKRLAQNSEGEIAVPVFDRDIEISRNAARIISKEAKFIIAEGNYLFLNNPEWMALDRYFDHRIWLDVPIAEIEKRLTARWLGYDYTPEMLAQKIGENDLPNAQYVIENSRKADFIVSNDAK